MGQATGKQEHAGSRQEETKKNKVKMLRNTTAFHVGLYLLIIFYHESSVKRSRLETIYSY
jgi:hypothetical protein